MIYHFIVFKKPVKQIQLKTSKTDPTTGKVRVEKKLTKKPFEEMMSDVLIVSASATAINLVGNGISHVIYALKKKKK